jgi:hypothetical protein
VANQGRVFELFARFRVYAAQSGQVAAVSASSILTANS